MKIKNIVYALSLLLLSSCGGESLSTGDKKVSSSNSSSSLSSSSTSSSSSSIITLIGEDGEKGVGAKNILESNKQKWALRNIKSYQYQFKISCFCMPDRTDSKQVTVSNGVVTEAFFLKTSDYLTAEQLLVHIKTVDELFVVIDQAISERAFEIKVTYNQAYGYPETISIDYDERMADDEITYYVKDLM